MKTKKLMLLTAAVIVLFTGVWISFRFNSGKITVRKEPDKEQAMPETTVASADLEKDVFLHEFGVVSEDLTSSVPSVSLKSPDLQVLPVLRESGLHVPAIAIVIDDFGYSLKLAEKLARITVPVTWTIIPDTPYSMQIAHLSEENHIPFLIHVPMQAISDKGKGKSLVGDGMTDLEIHSEINRVIGLFPEAFGINNHRGSKATSDPRMMAAVMDALSQWSRRLIFLDSRTIGSSVAYDMAVEKGIPALYNSVFLDHVESSDFMSEQLERAKKIARRRGWVVAICHVRPATVDFLSKLCIESDNEVEFFTVPELLKIVSEPKEVS